MYPGHQTSINTYGTVLESLPQWVYIMLGYFHIIQFKNHYFLPGSNLPMHIQYFAFFSGHLRKNHCYYTIPSPSPIRNSCSVWKYNININRNVIFLRPNATGIFFLYSAVNVCTQGTEGFEKHMDHLMELSEYMVEKIKSSPEKYHLLLEPEMVNVSFWYVPKRLRNVPHSPKRAQLLGEVRLWYKR